MNRSTTLLLAAAVALAVVLGIVEAGEHGSAVLVITAGELAVVAVVALLAFVRARSRSVVPLAFGMILLGIVSLGVVVSFVTPAVTALPVCALAGVALALAAGPELRREDWTVSTEE